MFFGWLKKRMPEKVKKCLLNVYNQIYELPVCLEGLYTKLYIRVCRVKPNKVVFDHFMGKPYGDNPKYIADEILSQKLGWDLVWLAKDPETPLPDGIRAVKYGTDEAMKEIASAKFFVDNVRSSARPHKKRGQIYLQTWHGGLGFKAVEGAAADKLHPGYLAAAMQDGKNCDGIIVECGLQAEEFKACFFLNDTTEILQTGLPRNDNLFDAETVEQTAERVRKTMKIDSKKRIILYMPTFRDDGSIDGYRLDYPEVISAFEKRFGEDFALLIRMHPNVQDHDSFIEYNDRILNATRYPDAQELYMTADYLITDYSSAAFDFSLLGRPAILCALDYEKYQNDRGLTDIFQRCPFPRVFTNEELIQCVEGFSLPEYNARFDEFKKIWRPFDRGDAARQIVEWMKAKNR